MIVEDEISFARRRAAEEKVRMTETSCVVRAVHEEFVELYEQRESEAAAPNLELEAMLARIA